MENAVNYPGAEKDIARLKEKASLSEEAFGRILDIISDEEIKYELKFNDIKEKDIEYMKKMGVLIKSLKNEVADKFYEHLLKFNKTRNILLSKEGLLEHLKITQAAYFEGLFDGIYDRKYFIYRLFVGFAHHSYGVTPSMYIGAYNNYLTIIWGLLEEELERGKINLNEISEFYRSVKKIIMLDEYLALETYYSNPFTTICPW